MTKKKRNIVDIILFFLAIGLDRAAKYYALFRLKERPAVSIISGILDFRYVENAGAAFGFLQGEKTFFIFVTFIVLCAVLYVLVRLPAKKRFLPLHLFLTFICAGAVGNAIDRIMYGIVIDFIYFSIIKFPVFNVADVFVSISTILLVLFIVFYYKEDDFNFLRFKEKKLREIK